MGASGGARSLRTLTDVNASTPADTEVLTYQSASSKWINAAGGGGGGSAGTINLRGNAATFAGQAAGTAGRTYQVTDTGKLYEDSGSAWVEVATAQYSRANHTGTQAMATISDAGSLATKSTVASADITDGTIVNVDINTSAAIAYSKLALTGAVLNADLAGSIAYSKLSLTGAILNADLAGSIALSKLATDPLARANHTGTQLAATISDFTTAAKSASTRYDAARSFR